MWVWLLLKFVAIIIIVSGAVSAIVLIGYSVWSLSQPKVKLTAEETKARQQKYEEAQIRRRWYDTAAAILLIGTVIVDVGTHNFPWSQAALAFFFSVIAVCDWRVTLSHRRLEQTEFKEH